MKLRLYHGICIGRIGDGAKIVMACHLYRPDQLDDLYDLIRRQCATKYPEIRDWTVKLLPVPENFIEAIKANASYP